LTKPNQCNAISGDPRSRSPPRHGLLFSLWEDPWTHGTRLRVGLRSVGSSVLRDPDGPPWRLEVTLMTRMIKVEIVSTFIVPEGLNAFPWALISRHLISGYLLATCLALNQPLPCTIIRVDASTRPGPPPRGASARTFLLPAPGNHASSSFLTLLTPSFRANNIYFELLALPTCFSLTILTHPIDFHLISSYPYCTAQQSTANS
jgi:hypothetical protein